MSEFLNPDDVVSTNKTALPLNRTTFTVQEILDTLQQRFDPNSQVFSEGVECKMLRPGGHWRNGRVRVTIEFIPDDNQ